MSKLINEDTLDKAAVVLKALAHNDRLQIVNLLLQGELNFGEIQRIIGTKQSNTSIQLSKLKWCGILKSRWDGNKVYYSLANDSIKRIVKSIIAGI